MRYQNEMLFFMSYLHYMNVEHTVKQEFQWINNKNLKCSCKLEQASGSCFTMVANTAL